jgi:hypothetical protein
MELGGGGPGSGDGARACPVTWLWDGSIVVVVVSAVDVEGVGCGAAGPSSDKPEVASVGDGWCARNPEWLRLIEFEERVHQVRDGLQVAGQEPEAQEALVDVADKVGGSAVWIELAVMVDVAGVSGVLCGHGGSEVEEVGERKALGGVALGARHDAELSPHDVPNPGSES